MATLPSRPYLKLCGVACAALVASWIVGSGRPVGAEQTAEGLERSLFVSVRDGDQLVRGLTAENFELREQGQVRDFTVREPGPAQIVLLVEMTPGVRAVTEDINAAVSGFAQSAVEGHWYALASFADELSIVEDFTRRPQAIIQAFPRVRLATDDYSRAFDAIHNVIDRLSLLSGRRVLIVVATGFDRGSSVSQPTVIDKVDSTNVLVFGLALGSEVRRAGRVNMSEARAFFGRLAQRSGGEAFFPLDSYLFYPAMARVFEALGAQYELVYVSRLRPGDRYHSVKVEAFHATERHGRRELDVTVRQGWK